MNAPEPIDSISFLCYHGFMDINDFTTQQLRDVSYKAFFELPNHVLARDYIRQETGITPPDWIVARLPEDLPRSEIGFDSRRFVDFMTGRKSEQIHELYDELRSEGRMIQFDDSVKDHVDGYMSKSMVFCDRDKDTGSVRGLMHEEQHADMVYSGYLDFIVLWKEWKDRPNPATAWAFLDAHPAFWTNSDIYGWNVEGGMELAHVGYFEHSPDGELVAFVDMGQTDPTDDYKTRFADPRLEIIGSTMEEAVLKLAKKTFEVHGLSREE